jgi:methyl-accepting chemotaxis protein
VKRYVEESGFPLSILVDESREVLKAYGVWHRIGLDALNIARPSLFLVEPDGRITYSFVAEKQHEFPSHAEIITALRHGQ